MKTICAFANDLDNWGGGYIVIGVEENNGRPVYPLMGVSTDKLDVYQKSIYAKCKLIRPAYSPIIGVETYQDKQFIVIWCPGGDNRPYSSPKTMARDNKERRADFNMRPIYVGENPYKGTYKRNHEGDYHATEHEIRGMIRRNVIYENESA